MDPNACLAEIRELRARIQRNQAAPNAGHPSLLEDTAEAAERLIELVDALDGWFSRGGFPPAAWARS